jgi:hypothetical protein
LLEVKNYEDEATVIRTLMLEAYCEIEIQSRAFVKDLPRLDTSVFYYEHGHDPLTAAEKQALRAMNVQDEAVRAVLQELLADACYSLVLVWLTAFDRQYFGSPILDAICERQGQAWQGARLAPRARYAYVDDFYSKHSVFYDIKQDIETRPPKRPF